MKKYKTSMSFTAYGKNYNGEFIIIDHGHWKEVIDDSGESFDLANLENVEMAAYQEEYNPLGVIVNLTEFLRELDREFTLTELGIYIPFLSVSHYSYETELYRKLEGSPSAISEVYLHIKGGTDWGTPSSTGESFYKLVFHWTTSSGHEILIRGAFAESADEGTFRVYKFSDHSENFYDRVEKVARKHIIRAVTEKEIENDMEESK